MSVEPAGRSQRGIKTPSEEKWGKFVLPRISIAFFLIFRYRRSMQKLYAYVDESGQDTGGALFVVGVVMLEDERDHILKELERIEEESGKKNIKWRKARPHQREAYMRGIADSQLFENILFFETFHHTKEYLELTSYTTAKAILKKAENKDYTVSIYVDGLKGEEIFLFRKEMKALHIRQRKIKGVRRDENNAFIRLADALCGLIRDVKDGQEAAADMFRLLEKNRVITAL